MATAKNSTLAQLAIAWLLAQGEDIIPIPGTKRHQRVDENAAAVNIELSADNLQQLNTIAPIGVAAGTRYPEAAMDTLNQ